MDNINQKNIYICTCTSDTHTCTLGMLACPTAKDVEIKANIYVDLGN